LPSDELGTAFANEIMPAIPADDRCRKFADCVVDHYIDSGCDFALDLWVSNPQQSLTTTNAADSFHSHLNADIKTPHPNICVCSTYVNTQQAYILTGSLAFTRAPSGTRSQKATQLLQFLQTIVYRPTIVASLTSSATFGALHITLRLSVLLSVCYEFLFSVYDDTDDVALLELQVAVY